MAASTIKTFLIATLSLSCVYTNSITTTNALSSTDGSSRRAFVSNLGTTSTAAILLASSTTGILTLSPDVAVAADAPAKKAVVMQNTENGVKFATTKPPKNPKSFFPQKGDIVAIEYTGYLTNGQIFDATHAQGKNKALGFALGSTAVIPGLNDIVSNMKVGQQVQAIIPPSMAFGDKGICPEGGDCLIKPDSTLVYDVILIQSSIPPP